MIISLESEVLLILESDSVLAVQSKDNTTAPAALADKFIVANKVSTAEDLVWAILSSQLLIRYLLFTPPSGVAEK